MAGNQTRVVEPNAGLRSPGQCLLAMRRHAEDIGVCIHENERVASLAMAGPSVELEVRNQIRLYDRVVVAAGPWTPRLLDELGPRLRVTRQHIWAKHRRERDRRWVPAPRIDLDRTYYGVTNVGRRLLTLARHVGGAEARSRVRGKKHRLQPG